MSEEHDKPVCGWVKLYHPSGVLVTLPVACPVENLGRFTDHYQIAFGCVSAALEAGFLVTMPGIEAGEEIDEIGAAVKREKENRDKSTSFVIDLYANHEAVNHPVLTIYLDSAEEEAAFERATGLKLASMPLYEGTSKIKRGDNAKLDKKICAFPRPARVAFVPNAKYSEEEATKARANGKVYAVPKRKFSRWVDLPAPIKEPTGDEIEATVHEWGDFLRADPSVSQLNERLPRLKTMHQTVKRRVWDNVKRHAELANLVFDEDRRVFMPRGAA